MAGHDLLEERTAFPEGRLAEVLTGAKEHVEGHVDRRRRDDVVDRRLRSRTLVPFLYVGILARLVGENAGAMVPRPVDFGCPGIL